MKEFLKEYQIELTILILLITMVVLFCLSGCSARAPTIVQPPKSLFSGHDNDTNTALVWIVTLSIFGIGACVAAAIFLPVKKLAVASCAGFGATLSLALTVKAALPFLPWFALGCGLLAIAAAIWYFRKYVTAAQAAKAFGIAMTAANSEVEAQAVIEAHAVSQDVLGVKSLLDGLKPTKPPTA